MSSSEKKIMGDVAMLAHNVNAAYCRALGDDSQPDWYAAPQWQKDSAIAGVLAIAANPGLAPEQSHEMWMAQKLADGWTYGPVKDAGAKTHPCMVPYADLPESQRAKDHIFGAVVRNALHVLETGYAVAS